uniref:uncharacterized protein LOC118538498 n=1 Tax=Halichoerus grypus TaxID=9711 RepID=UPI00165A09F5|nr:uncharacterized protein LOC118538498 [Halichoerus grypus]
MLWCVGDRVLKCSKQTSAAQGPPPGLGKAAQGPHHLPAPSPACTLSQPSTRGISDTEQSRPDQTMTIIRTPRAPATRAGMEGLLLELAVVLAPDGWLATAKGSPVPQPHPPEPPAHSSAPSQSTRLPGPAPVSSFTSSLVLLGSILQDAELIGEDLTGLKHLDSSSHLTQTLGSAIPFPWNPGLLFPDRSEYGLEALGSPSSTNSSSQDKLRALGYRLL